MMEHIKSIYFKDNKSYLRALVLREHEYYIYKFQKYLRGEEAAKTIFFKVYYRIKTNILGRKLGFTIPPDVFAEGLHIWHYGNIVVNRGARVGKNCVLHGDNCMLHLWVHFRGKIVICGAKKYWNIQRLLC